MAHFKNFVPTINSGIIDTISILSHGRSVVLAVVTNGSSCTSMDLSRYTEFFSNRQTICAQEPVADPQFLLRIPVG